MSVMDKVQPLPNSSFTSVSFQVRVGSAILRQFISSTVKRALVNTGVFELRSVADQVPDFRSKESLSV